MNEDKLRLYLSKRIRGFLAGQHESSQLYTRGHDLEERRPFRMGDHPMSINQLATAKRNDETPRVSVHRIEKGVNILFLIDSSASMKFGTLTGKNEYAIKLAEHITHACMGEGNRFRFVVFDSDICHDSGYKTSKNETEMAIEEIGSLPLTTRQETNLKIALEYLLGNTSSITGNSNLDLPGLIFVISDFLLAANFEPQLDELTEQSDIIVLELRDPTELNLPRPKFGLVELTDPETGKRFWSRGTRDPLDNIAPILKRYEVDCLRINTAEDVGMILENLAELFEKKKE